MASLIRVSSIVEKNSTAFVGLDSKHRYVNEGIPTGSFLGAVLENDLMGAMGRADQTNRHNIFEICMYVYNTLPSSVWGNPDKVRNHLDKYKG